MAQLPFQSLAAVICLGLITACKPAADDRMRCLEESLADLVDSRWVEPRLSGGFAWEACEERPIAGRILAEVICRVPHTPAPSVSTSVEPCDENETRHVAALQKLTQDSDLDGAITTLKQLADEPGQDPRVWSDLSAAFMVRARRRDRPADLLPAIAAARRAVAAHPSPEALFNLALAQEALHLSEQAKGTWRVYLDRQDDARWTAAGRRHRDRLERRSLRAAGTAWPLNRQRLPDAIRLGDREAVARLVAPFPGAAYRYVEEEALPAWARLTTAGDPQARQHLSEAREVAGAIARTTGDRYLRDVVEVVAAADRRRDTATLRALARGHALLAEARQLALAPGEEERYRQAAAFLGAGGSPLRVAAEVGAAAARSRRVHEGSCSQALAVLEPLESSARRRGHESLLARFLWVRGYCLAAQGRLPDALSTYAEALARYRQRKDGEGAANVRARMAGVARDLGEKELAWGYAWQALRDIGFVVELERQHYVLGEAAEAALRLDEPQTAVLYLTDAVDRIRENLGPPGNPQASRLRSNLGIALRARAPILALLGRHLQAREDVQNAIRFFNDTPNEDVRRALLARAKEAEARTLLRREPRAAIKLLKEAIGLYPSDQFRTYRANLHFLLARTHWRMHDPAGAEEALKAGLAEIADEEKRVLELRKPGESEHLWGPYFSRFREAYEQLVRLLVVQGRHDEAFGYIERARAVEPLDLVLRLRSGPRTFERLIAQREPLALADVQAQLPAGTFLLDYYLLDGDEMDEEQLVVWVVWHGGSELLSRGVGHPQIRKWAELFQTARGGDTESFVVLLEEVFTALVGAPLEQLTRNGQRADVERLVFIPDRAINGLPLAALRDPATKKHLIDDFTIAVAPSATLYVFSLLRDRQLRGEPASALLVGNPAFDAKLDVARDLGPLDWAAREVAEIKPLYHPRVEMLETNRATVDAFLRQARAKSVVHFAGHAVANADAPARSVLLLTPSATHSGALRAEELLGKLELERTRLVVLSACSSTSGGAIGPSGIAPLVRPFLAGGVPAVVGTLWNVPDPFPASLLASFHHHLADGDDAATALREAQLELRRKQSSKAELVLVWAPFQVVGYASSPFPPH